MSAVESQSLHPFCAVPLWECNRRLARVAQGLEPADGPHDHRSCERRGQRGSGSRPGSPGAATCRRRGQ